MTSKDDRNNSDKKHATSKDDFSGVFKFGSVKDGYEYSNNNILRPTYRKFSDDNIIHGLNNSESNIYEDVNFNIDDKLYKDHRYMI